LKITNKMFQSTRPCGARPVASGIPAIMGSFNPRARAGRDSPVGGSSVGCIVSIHAPVRGATLDAAVTVFDAQFQSTRPCGARLPIAADTLTIDGFNPRARAGRDTAKSPVLDIPDVSIHAPVRGATRGYE